MHFAGNGGGGWLAGFEYGVLKEGRLYLREQQAVKKSRIHIHIYIVLPFSFLFFCPKKIKILFFKDECTIF